MRIIFILFAVCLSCCLKAQLTVNAGRDTTVCAGSPVVLGGNPTASGGTGPYSYQWSPSTGLSCDTCANPIATAGSVNTYTVTVIDAAHDTISANINFQVNSLPIVNVTASDTSVCAGQQVYLQASASELACGFAPACSSTLTSSQIGNGNTLQPGLPWAYPAIFGNYDESCRQQIMYSALELLQVLGGPKTIDGIGFDVGLFNSNAYLENFTIKITCTSIDSLTHWNETVLTVVEPATIQPSAGWNDFAFTHPYYWDGISNIIVELCFYGAGLYGNQVNKALCTVTPNSSYIYSAENFNQCDTTTVPIISNIRPNIRFGYCSSANPDFTYSWFPQTGVDSVFSPTNQNTYVAPDSSTTYYLNVTGNNLCSTSDSIKINVRPASIYANLQVSNVSCNGQSDGSVQAILLSADSFLYNLFNANYTLNLQTGAGVNNDTAKLAGLSAGNYHLVVSDSVCSDIDYPLTVLQPNPLQIIINFSIDNYTRCYGDSSASICIDVAGGVPPYNYSWFPSSFSGRCPTNMYAGNYSVTVTDANSCSATNNDVQITNQPPISFQVQGNIPGDSTDSVTILIDGGVPNFSINWGDGYLTHTFAAATHVYGSAGEHSLTITDANGCTFYDSINTSFVQGLTQLFIASIKIHPNPASNQLFIESNEFAIDEIEIVDVTGKQVLHQYLKGVHNTNVNISGLSDGVYVINATSNGLTYHSRFIKVK